MCVQVENSLSTSRSHYTVYVMICGVKEGDGGPTPVCSQLSKINPSKINLSNINPSKICQWNSRPVRRPVARCCIQSSLTTIGPTFAYMVYSQGGGAAEGKWGLLLRK